LSSTAYMRNVICPILFTFDMVKQMLRHYQNSVRE